MATQPDNTAPSLSESAARPSRRSMGGAEAEENLLPFSAFYDQKRYGYLLQSEDQEFELRFNALLQADARIYAQETMSPVVSDINIPRMRLYFSGRMTKPIEYQLSLQRSTNGLDLLNAYLNFHYDDRFQLRFGRFKSPYTYEWYKMSIWEMSTPDRSPFALNFGPNRQMGLMGWGFLFKERLEYAVGLMDGPRNSYQDTNFAKDVMALLDFKPFYQTDSPLKNFGFGGSVDEGRENNPAVPAVLRTSTTASANGLSTTSGDNLIAVPFLAFNNNVRERGDRQLWEMHATFFYKQLALLGVWDSGHNDFSLTGPTARPVHLPVSGYFVQASYILTGEERQRQALINPKRPFDLRRGKFGPGALELQARYSELALGRQVFTGGLADPNLWSNRLNMIDVGLNWYLNKFVKFYFDWEHAIFGQPVLAAPGPIFQKTNNLFWLRLQIYL
jgi:phosphate-selective porin OprO/OprP